MFQYFCLSLNLENRAIIAISPQNSPNADTYLFRMHDDIILKITTIYATFELFYITILWLLLIQCYPWNRDSQFSEYGAKSFVVCSLYPFCFSLFSTTSTSTITQKKRKREIEVDAVEALKSDALNAATTL